MSDEITSPPYPSQATTAKSLYRHLITLRSWAQEHKDELIDLVPPSVRPHLEDDLPGIPSESVWENVGVADKFFVMTGVCSIRDDWDEILKHHEDSWECQLSLQRRFRLIMSVYRLLEEAFVSPEVREMKSQKAMGDMVRQQKVLSRHFQKVMNEYSSKNKEKTNEEEEDGWQDETDPHDHGGG